MNLKELKQELMKNPEFAKEYNRFDLWFELDMFWTKIRIWFWNIKKIRN